MMPNKTIDELLKPRDPPVWTPQQLKELIDQRARAIRKAREAAAEKK